MSNIRMICIFKKACVRYRACEQGRYMVQVWVMGGGEVGLYDLLD